jgi:phosphotriesterase-related protein
MPLDRREFLGLLALAATRSAASTPPDERRVLTVAGPVPAASLGTTLAHEHVLVDFAGADKVGRDRYDADEAFARILPHLRAVRAAGCTTLVECTPAYLGRDPRLLLRLAEASGLTLLTNTGYYGANGGRHLPAHALEETAEQLAARWTAEFEDGIEGTGVRPGFVKSGVGKGPLSPVDRKLVRAAAITHRRTGLTVYVHTGDGAAALDSVAALQAEGVAPDAYVWVHAQNETDRETHVRAAQAGAWVSFDGVSPEALDGHVDAVLEMTRRGCLRRLLVSQDAGWYRVGEPGGGSYRGHTFLFEAFVPALEKRGFTQDEVRTLLVANPAEALAVRLRPER